eukprot:1770936-Prorocentrum_lima.AAC.1
MREIKGRIATAMTVWRRLDPFWMHSNCPLRFKMHAWDAIVKAKVLYGLESLQLTAAQRDKLDVFHLKGLRKILHLQTTFVRRDNTNSR